MEVNMIIKKFSFMLKAVLNLNAPIFAPVKEAIVELFSLKLKFITVILSFRHDQRISNKR